MSLSTRIEDLPDESFIALDPKKDEDHVTYEEVRPTSSNISMEFTSKESAAQNAPVSLMDQLKAELNETNLALLILFILAGLPYLDPYLEKIPFLGAYTNTVLQKAFVKGILLFVAFYAVRYFLGRA
jgi:hypothetical protein